MKKNILALLLTCLISASMFGCGESNGNDSSAANNSVSTDNEQSASSTVSNTAAKDDNVPDAGGATITLWLPPFSSGETTDKEFWTEQLTDAADEINANLSIDIVPWANYEEKYMTGIASGSGPDIGYMYNEMLYNYIDMGSLEALDDYFTQEESDNYIYWELGNINGVQYTLPFVVGGPRILFCNMDLLNEAGYDSPPSTWGELEEIAAKTADVTGKIGFQQAWGAFFGSLNEVFYPFLWQAGGDIFDDEGNLIINNEAGLEAATWLYSLKEKGILPESCTSVDGDAVEDEFLDGNIGMIISSATLVAKLENVDMNWGYIPYLSKTEGSDGYTMSAADCLVLLSTCENKEAAIYLMKYITSASVMETFHTDLNSYPPISKDEKYLDTPEFESMYEDYSDGFRTLPVAANSSQIFTTLYSNLQLMMMGEITPQEALDNTVSYAEALS